MYFCLDMFSWPVVTNVYGSRYLSNVLKLFVKQVNISQSVCPSAFLQVI